MTAQAQYREAAVKRAKAMHDLSFAYKEKLLRFRRSAFPEPVPIPQRDFEWWPSSSVSLTPLSNHAGPAHRGP